MSWRAGSESVAITAAPGPAVSTVPPARPVPVSDDIRIFARSGDRTASLNVMTSLPVTPSSEAETSSGGVASAEYATAVSGWLPILLRKMSENAPAETSTSTPPCPAQSMACLREFSSSLTLSVSVSVEVTREAPDSERSSAWPGRLRYTAARSTLYEGAASMASSKTSVSTPECASSEAPCSTGGTVSCCTSRSRSCALDASALPAVSR